MRTVVVLLVLANLTFLGYSLLDRVSSGEAVRLEQQILPDKIKLLTPQQVAALGPTKSASLADVCIEWGPFTDAERARALADLEPLALGRLLTPKRLEVSNPFWVYLPPVPSKADADRRANDLRNRGVKDAFVVDSGPQRLAVSLGVFRGEEAANAYLAELGKLGITGARVGPRQQPLLLTSLVIRDPPAAAVTRLRELAGTYANVDLRIGACEKP